MSKETLRSNWECCVGFSENLLASFCEISHIIPIYYLGLLTGSFLVIGLKEDVGQESKSVHGKLSISEL